MCNLALSIEGEGFLMTEVYISEGDGSIRPDHRDGGEAHHSRDEGCRRRQQGTLTGSRPLWRR